MYDLFKLFVIIMETIIRDLLIILGGWLSMDINKRMEEMNICLPPIPPKGGLYAPIKEFGNKFVYLSGFGPITEGFSLKGKLGSSLTIDAGYKAAQHCMLNMLASIRDKFGDLNKVKSFIKITVFVASENDFFMQPQVANGATQLLMDIFGEEAGLPARSAIGVNVLPGDIPVEIEALIELV